MRITVLGTGYVGLVAGACFSDSGNHVVCADVNRDKIRHLEQGKLPIFEPGLEEIVSNNLKAGRLQFSAEPAVAVKDSAMVFIAVGTPQGEDGSSDLTYVLDAVGMLRENLKRDTIVVLKSTVPVGTADLVREKLKGIAHRVDVVSNPEFLKEGSAVSDFLRPERVIIGTESETCRQVMADLYSPYTRSGKPVLFMSNRSAELSKYAANAFLAMKISFINDIALLAEKVDADVRDVRRGLITDSRIGSQFLYPGCGYGGSCFPKDVLALTHLGSQVDHPLELLAAVHRTNERQKKLMFQKIHRHFKGDVAGKTIAIWGLSFKPMTDDMREAPSVSLIEELLAAGARVQAFDPVAADEAKRIFEGKIEVSTDAYAALKSADALAILTEWNEFRSPDFDCIKQELKSPVIFDGRNVYNPDSLARLGFKYYSVGKADPV